MYVTYNDIIRIDYQLKETINYELGNTYVNGKLFKSGDTIVIDENLNILIETNVKKFGINTNIGNGATLYMERISSPYANADLGFINNGDILYYGDVIQLNAKYEGRYEGIIKVNEKRIFNYDRITITSDINVVVETTYNPQTWEIIYEDSTIYEFGFGETTENVNLKLPVNIDFGISREVRFTCEYTVTDSDGNKRIFSDVVKELPYEYHPYADSYCNISVALNSSNEILCSRRNGAREIENYNIEYSITQMMLKKIEQHK